MKNKAPCSSTAEATRPESFLPLCACVHKSHFCDLFFGFALFSVAAAVEKIRLELKMDHIQGYMLPGLCPWRSINKNPDSTNEMVIPKVIKKRGGLLLSRQKAP